MLPFYKLLLFLIISSLVLLSGYSLYRFLNRKINESETGLQVLSYSLLLVLACAVLFFGGLFVLIKNHNFVRDAE